MRSRMATLLLLLGLATTVRAVTPASSGSGTGAPVILSEAIVRDLPAADRLFERGIPMTPESISPGGFSYAYLHQIPGGFLRRKPERCAFLLDLGTGENRPVKTPKGRAARIAGWDPTGRYLLIETTKPDFLSALTGSWTTYHWILDVVTSGYIKRTPFTGMRNGRRFRWNQKGTYHGEWSTEGESLVIPLEDGELVAQYEARSDELEEEDRRRRELAGWLAVGTSARPNQDLAEVLPRLDVHWTKRGQRDAVISEIFGERPVLYASQGNEWVAIEEELEYVAILDHGLTLMTGAEGRQAVLERRRWEVVPLPEPPEGFVELLESRWNRDGEFYDELDPLPRDLQYRREYDVTQGTAYYFNWVSPDRARLFMLYSYGPAKRVLRVVDLPEAWRITPPSGD